MKISIKHIVITILAIGVFLIGAFVYFIFYNTEEDVSNKMPYAQYLNTPIEIKHICTMRWNKGKNGAKDFYTLSQEDADIDYEDVKSVKKYYPSDKITFYAAKNRFNYHTGESYYLLGRDTLDNGEPIEFSYFYQDKHFNNIWETEDEFLERVKKPD